MPRCISVVAVSTYYAIEQMPFRTFAPGKQAKIGGGKGAFPIIIDDNVRVVSILLIKLVPYGKVGFDKGLFQMASGLLYAGNALHK